MDHNRQKLIDIIVANEGLSSPRNMNLNLIDGTVRIYDTKAKLSDVYARIADNPIPFLLFMLKIKELKKEQKDNPSVLG